MTTTVTARIDLDGSRFDRNNPTVEYFGRTIAHRPERDQAVALHPTARLTGGEFERTGGSERYPAVGDTDNVVIEVTDVPAGHPDLNDPDVTIVEDEPEQETTEVEETAPEPEPVYVHLDTDALDALDPVDAYKAVNEAANKAISQIKAATSAYADAIAYRLAEQHGHRGAARLLGTSQPPISDRVHRHRRRTMRITADHVRNLHEEGRAYGAQLEQAHGRRHVVLAYVNGEVTTCVADTADHHGWPILYSSYDLDAWLDGTDLTDSDADQIAEEANRELA